jgi:hypothetical protein
LAEGGRGFLCLLSCFVGDDFCVVEFQREQIEPAHPTLAAALGGACKPASTIVCPLAAEMVMVDFAVEGLQHGFI